MNKDFEKFLVDKENRLIINPNAILDKKYTIQKFIGKGTFSNVYHAKHVEFPHENYAIKVTLDKPRYQKCANRELNLYTKLTTDEIYKKVKSKINDESKSGNQKSSIQRDLTCLHPNLIHLIDSFQIETESLSKILCFVFSKAETNLYQVIKKNNFCGLHVKDIYNISISLLSGLEFLTKHNIVHLDLKPENIVIFRDKQPYNYVKIIDIGSAENLDTIKENRFKYEHIQTRYYRSPESILLLDITPRTDLWSFGCIIYEIIMGHPLFVSKCQTDLLKKILNYVAIPTKVMEQNVEFRDIISDVFSFKCFRWHYPYDRIETLCMRNIVTNKIYDLPEDIYSLEEKKWLTNIDHGPIFYILSCIKYHFARSSCIEPIHHNFIKILKPPPISTGETINESSHRLICTTSL